MRSHNHRAKSIAIVLVACGALSLSGCGVARAGDFSGPTGTFMFKSQGHSTSGQVMYEAGFVTISSDGRACVTSTMNTDGQVQGVTNLPADPCRYGAYPRTGSFDPLTRIGVGGAPVGQGEGSTSYVSPDGQTIYAVGHEESGWTWLLEAHKISN